MAEIVSIEGCSDCAPLIELLRRQVAQLEQKVRELSERVEQNSSNSHMPPSSDRPGAGPPKQGKEPSGRSRGAQLGHKGKAREMVAEQEVDEFVECKPAHCKGCGSDLSGQDDAAQRHQVMEIPQIKPHVTEYRLHALVCHKCLVITRADLPEGVPPGNFGPRFEAIASVASGTYQLSKRKTELMLWDFFGAKVSLGSIVKMQQTTSRVLAPVVEEAKAWVQEQSHANMDETPWMEGPEKSKAYVWVLVSGLVAVFAVQARRTTEAAKSLLGKFAGVLGTDRLKSYGFIDVLRHQFCWAHLKRDFAKIRDRGGPSGPIGEDLLRCQKNLFVELSRARDGTIRWSTFQAYASKLRVEVRRILERGLTCPDKKTAGTCRELLAAEPAMWTFVRVKGMGPTNNASEQSLRQAVIWRKLSFGTQSPEGSRFVERMLTVVHSLRLQRRNVLEFVTAARQAALHNRPAPSLLPLSVQLDKAG